MHKISVSELPPENELHPQPFNNQLPVPMPLPDFEPNLCPNEKGGKFEFILKFRQMTKIGYHMMRLHEEITMLFKLS
jgi:hypothetical protein